MSSTSEKLAQLQSDPPDPPVGSGQPIDSDLDTGDELEDLDQTTECTRCHASAEPDQLDDGVCPACWQPCQLCRTPFVPAEDELRCESCAKLKVKYLTIKVPVFELAAGQYNRPRKVELQIGRKPELSGALKCLYNGMLEAGVKMDSRGGAYAGTHAHAVQYLIELIADQAKKKGFDLLVE